MLAGGYYYLKQRQESGKIAQSHSDSTLIEDLERQQSSEEAAAVEVCLTPDLDSNMIGTAFSQIEVVESPCSSEDSNFEENNAQMLLPSAAAAVKAVPAIPGHSLERKESNDTAKTEEITDEVDIVENDCFSIMSSCTNCDRVNLSDFVEYAREVGGMRADDSIIRRQ